MSQALLPDGEILYNKKEAVWLLSSILEEKLLALPDCLSCPTWQCGSFIIGI